MKSKYAYDVQTAERICFEITSEKICLSWKKKKKKKKNFYCK